MAAKWPKSSSSRPPRISVCLAFPHFGFLWPSEASRWLQDYPRGPPKRGPRDPMTAPRAPKSAPITPQQA
eukprot:2136058-Pyramimonas_sp.AAC.1